MNFSIEYVQPRSADAMWYQQGAEWQCTHPNMLMAAAAAAAAVKDHEPRGV
jgi:hypothetical protein